MKKSKKKSGARVPNAELEAAPAPPPSLWQLYFAPILATIVALSFLSKLIRVDYPANHVYDEVYYAFTTELLVQGDPRVFDWLAKPPPAPFAYEWTHPPLAKSIIALGVAAFGPNPLGWRFSSLIFGSATILMSALIAWKLFERAEIALLTAAFLSVEGLLFVQSRVCMIDVHVLFFMLTCLYFYLSWRREPDDLFCLAGAGLAMGAAAAAKWNSAVLILIIAPDLLYRWIIRPCLPSRLWIAIFPAVFIALPAAVYLSSYAQFFAMGYGFDHLIEHQREMWYYHSRLSASHAYSSDIWQWLLNLNPVWMWVERGADGSAGVIYNLGNHVILYGGLFALLWCARRWRAAPSWPLGSALACYFILLLPWMMSPRIKFFQHYLPAIPFLAILLSYALFMHNRDEKTGQVLRRSFAAEIMLALSIAWLAVFYCFLTGVQVPKGFMQLFNLLILNPGVR